MESPVTENKQKTICDTQQPCFDEMYTPDSGVSPKEIQDLTAISSTAVLSSAHPAPASTKRLQLPYVLVLLFKKKLWITDDEMVKVCMLGLYGEKFQM